MSLLSNFILALAKVIDIVVGIYTFIVAGAVIISWIRPDPYNPIVRFLHSATEPLFSRCRRFLPSFLYKTGIDWTPMLVIILLVFLETLLVGTLTDIGLNLRNR
jgi:YggT family protein